jgi:hypothetical protein
VDSSPVALACWKHWKSARMSPENGMFRATKRSWKILREKTTVSIEGKFQRCDHLTFQRRAQPSDGRHGADYLAQPPSDTGVTVPSEENLSPPSAACFSSLNSPWDGNVFLKWENKTKHCLDKIKHFRDLNPACGFRKSGLTPSSVPSRSCKLALVPDLRAFPSNCWLPFLPPPT